MRHLACLCLAAIGCGDTRVTIDDITPAPMIVTGYALAWDGAAFTAVWGGVQADQVEHRLWAMRISPAGDVIAPATSIAGLTAAVSSIELEPVGDRLVIAHRQANGSGNLTLRRLDLRTMLAEDPVTVSTLSGGTGLGLASAGDRVVALWCKAGTFVRTYDANLSPSSPITVDATGVDNPVLVTLLDGSLHATWVSASRIRSARLDAAGAIITPPALVHDTATTQIYPATAPLENGDVLVSWLDGPFTRRAFWRIGPDGTPRWPAHTFPLPENRIHSVDIGMAWHDDRVLLVWQEDTSGGLPRIAAGFLDETGTGFVDRFEVTDGRYPAGDPKLAVTPDDVGVLSNVVGMGRYMLQLDVIE